MSVKRCTNMCTLPDEHAGPCKREQFTPNEVFTIAEVRRRIATLPEDERCSPGCKGWDVFETNTERGIEVERCDECFGSLPDDSDLKIWDDDVQQLPEAIEALRLAQQEFDHG